MTIQANFERAYPRTGREAPRFRDLDEALAAHVEDEPLHCLWPQRLERQACRFVEGFCGTVAYAVKCNPHPDVIRILRAAGIVNFDVASAREVDTVLAAAPDARLWYMHPVKSRAAISHAWRRGVREFAIDSMDELLKLRQLLGPAPGLGLHVRLAVGSDDAAWSLSGKFGATPTEAIAILREASGAASSLGLCFHVGSQCMSPDAFRRAVAHAGQVAAAAEVPIAVLDVGGGFPAAYPGLNAPPLDDYFRAVRDASLEYGFGEAQLLCEPGRALVAAGGSLLVRVDLRRGDALYINDGVYGALFDAGFPGWRYPVRRLRPGTAPERGERPFRFFGPTCDTLDSMKGPFLLPDDIREGDWIEVQQLGAYGAAVRSGFNGFSTTADAAVITEACHE